MFATPESIAPAADTSIRSELASWRLLALAAAEAAAARNEPRAFRALLERALEATGADRAFVVTARREGGRLEPSVIARVSRRADGREELSRTVLQRALASPRALVCPEGGDDPRLADAASVKALRLRAVVAAPVRRPDGSDAALVLDSSRAIDAACASGELLAGFAALAGLLRGGDETKADRSAGGTGSSGPLLGRAPDFRRAIEQALRAAATTLPVLVQGETGTGKESLARSIHDASPRRAGPFVALNCAAVPEALIEAELFGAARGAYTGAERDRLGLLRAANAGTLFLDEVGDMPLPMQGKLLRVLQDGRVRAVGVEHEIVTDVRIVAATHRDLPRLVAAGGFREDLYWRLAVVTVPLPPLRARPDDLAELAAHLLDGLTRRHGLPDATLSEAGLARLRAHAWPGNVRELEAVLARAVLAHGGGELPRSALEPFVASAATILGDGSRLEVEMIRKAIADTDGVVEAARRIGWSRQKLHRRMASLGIPPRATRRITP